MNTERLLLLRLHMGTCDVAIHRYYYILTSLPPNIKAKTLDIYSEKSSLGSRLCLPIGK